MKLLSKVIFLITGWKVKGGLPAGVKKCILVGAPHTSNFDFIYGMCGLTLLGIKLRFLAKKELFKFPLGWLLTGLGGIPVDRSKKNSMVDAIAELFESHNELVVMVPPEGTRKKVERWRTGFYYSALKAGVPIVLGYLDYKTKIASVGPAFYPTGDIENDFNFFKEYYKGITPKYPELFDVESIKPV